MKWQRNPKSIDFGIYAYKKKNTDDPVIINVSITTGIPAHTRGWWLGPMEGLIEIEGVACMCGNCAAWQRRGKSIYGTCHKHPPIDNNWSSPQETEQCFEFLPKESLYVETDNN